VFCALRSMAPGLPACRIIAGTVRQSSKAFRIEFPSAELGAEVGIFAMVALIAAGVARRSCGRIRWRSDLASFTFTVALALDTGRASVSSGIRIGRRDRDATRRWDMRHFWEASS